MFISAALQKQTSTTERNSPGQGRVNMFQSAAEACVEPVVVSFGRELDALPASPCRASS